VPRIESKGPSIEALAVFKLTIEDDEGKTTVIPLIRDEMTIGRQEGNTIRLTERNVSRKHARLVRQNGTLFIEDLASFTGVKVNGSKIAALTAVREGDEVHIGDYKLMVRAERPPVAVPVDGERATTPSMPAALAPPIATVGGSVAIPTRPTAASMAAVASINGARPNSSPTIPAVLPPAPAAAPAAAAPPPTPVPVPPPAANHTHAHAAGTPDPLEAQPTIPVRMLGEAPPPAPVAEAAPPARLVTLTTELAGMEFALSRGSLVIGRTDENEIVLNHRSISRHHAKVVREGDRYTIVDLQSANGVRVNGEDYERIELHAGDVVELGHVKLRFVGPFEHYVFDPNARHDRGRFPTRIAVGASVAALLSVIAVVVVYRARHESEPATAQAEAPPAAVAAAPAPTAPVAAAPPAAPAPAAAAPVTATDPAGLLAAATKAIGGEDWETARVALDRLGTQQMDPSMRKQALALGRRVDTERRGATAFARFDEAQVAKNYAAAVARYGDIPADSVYRARAKDRYEETRVLLASSHMSALQQALSAGRCAEVRQEADEIVRLDPQNKSAREMVSLCHAHPEPVAAASRPPRPRPASAVTAQSRSERQDRGQDRGERADRTEHTEAVALKRPEPAPAESDLDVDVLIKQAREAWLKQQCGSALELSRRVLKAKPGYSDAYQIIAACSCSLKDADGASRAYAKVDEKSRSLVRKFCEHNGVTVGND
jgi:pSer/pThr/pTyr-binding forkhead associated (FHA) protein